MNTETQGTLQNCWAELNGWEPREETCQAEPRIIITSLSLQPVE